MKMAATSPGVAVDVPSPTSKPMSEVGMGTELLVMAGVWVGKMSALSEVEGLGPLELLETPVRVRAVTHGGSAQLNMHEYTAPCVPP